MKYVNHCERHVNHSTLPLQNWKGGHFDIENENERGRIFLMKKRKNIWSKRSTKEDRALIFPHSHLNKNLSYGNLEIQLMNFERFDLMNQPMFFFLFKISFVCLWKQIKQKILRTLVGKAGKYSQGITPSLALSIFQ